MTITNRHTKTHTLTHTQQHALFSVGVCTEWSTRRVKFSGCATKYVLLACALARPHSLSQSTAVPLMEWHRRVWLYSVTRVVMVMADCFGEREEGTKKKRSCEEGVAIEG